MASVPWAPKLIRILSVLSAFIGTLGVNSGILFFIILSYESPNPSPIECLWLFTSIFYLQVGVPMISAGLYNNRWSIIGNYTGAFLGTIVFYFVTIWGAVLQWGTLSHCANPRAGTFDVYFCAAQSFLDGFLAIVVISWVMALFNLILGGVDLLLRGILSPPHLVGTMDIPLVGTHMPHHHKETYAVEHKAPHHHKNLREHDVPLEYYDDREYI